MPLTIQFSSVFIHAVGNETETGLSSDSEWSDSDNEALSAKKINLSFKQSKSEQTGQKDANFF